MRFDSLAMEAFRSLEAHSPFSFFIFFFFFDPYSFAFSALPPSVNIERVVVVVVVASTQLTTAMMSEIDLSWATVFLLTTQTQRSFSKKKSN
jgi:hypothetical protein